MNVCIVGGSPPSGALPRTGAKNQGCGGAVSHGGKSLAAMTDDELRRIVAQGAGKTPRAPPRAEAGAGAGAGDADADADADTGGSTKKRKRKRPKVRFELSTQLFEHNYCGRCVDAPVLSFAQKRLLLHVF